jgi:hypothetical protein
LFRSRDPWFKSYLRQSLTLFISFPNLTGGSRLSVTSSATSPSLPHQR